MGDWPYFTALARTYTLSDNFHQSVMGGTGANNQPIDFFGDGTRIPLLVVSPFSTEGNVVHSYGDHVSILKFIDRNWSLSPLTSRSRDNLPNPVASSTDPFVPTNSPAIGDLFDMFNFKH